MKLIEVNERNLLLLENLLRIWEEAVRATTCFYHLKKSTTLNNMFRNF